MDCLKWWLCKWLIEMFKTDFNLFLLDGNLSFFSLFSCEKDFVRVLNFSRIWHCQWEWWHDLWFYCQSISFLVFELQCCISPSSLLFSNLSNHFLLQLVFFSGKIFWFHFVTVFYAFPFQSCRSNFMTCIQKSTPIISRRQYYYYHCYTIADREG